MGVGARRRRAGRPHADRHRRALVLRPERTSSSGGRRARRPRGRRSRSRWTPWTGTACGSPTSSSRSSRIADLTGGNRTVAQNLAQSLQAMLGFALLTAVDTYTYRSDSVMLSTAQSYRPGYASEQHHISQATLDEQAIVFTTHPKNEPQSGTQWPDDDGYWTGQRQPAARRAARRAVDQPLRARLREPGTAARRVQLPRLHARVLPAGAVRRGRAGRTAGRSAARATATWRCGRGGRCSGAPTPIRASSPTG